MNKNSIGTNAGILWHILETRQNVTYSELKNLSGWSDQELFAAIGWLAKEDKINFNRNSSDEDTISLHINFFF